MRTAVFTFILLLVFIITSHSQTMTLRSSVVKMNQELLTKHGEKARERIEQGVRQVSDYWRTSDGDAKAFEDFVRNNFISDPNILDETLKRFEYAYESLFGHLHEINVALREQSDLEIGAILPLDEILGAYDPYAHVNDDFFGPFLKQNIIDLTPGIL